MDENQREILKDVEQALVDKGWAFYPASGERPVLEVPFRDGIVVVTIAWRRKGEDA